MQTFIRGNFIKHCIHKLALLFIFLFIGFISFAQLPDDTETIKSADILGFEKIKGTPDTNDVQRFCYLSVYIDLELVKINAWTGKATFKGHVNQDPSLSWIKSGFKNQENLVYLQSIYSLSQLFSLKLEKYMNGRYLPFMNLLENVKSKAVKEYNTELKNEISKFEAESDFGRNKQVVADWRKEIIADLVKYE
jgi:hypothetical protein